MPGQDFSLPVVAGIDGSDTAINAAQWAVDEAISRSVPLRLVYVTKATHPSAEDYHADMHRAEESLRAAQAAIEATGRPVKIETAIVPGSPHVSLVTESRDADLVCVGSVGIDRSFESILGSTATELAENAYCPVAIIRPSSEVPDQTADWIIAAVTDDPDNESVVEAAMEEAKLRRAPVLLLGKRKGLDSRVEGWKRRYPDVHAYPVADHADISRFLRNHDECVQLAVIGAADADQVMQILGPHGHPRFHRRVASVLVERH